MPSFSKRRRTMATAPVDLVDTEKITTVEQLENYKRSEERTKVIIPKEKLPLFSKSGLFRNIVKNSIDDIHSTLNDIPDKRTYIIREWDSLPEVLRDLIVNESVEHSKVFHTVNYKDLTAEEAFKLVIDDDKGVMVGFETVGHIAHLNLPNERESIKKLIAKIILDKHHHIKTVINKKSMLVNQFRTMDFEHLAGEVNYITSLIENGFKFELDFKNVYWNSRLIQERNRIRDLLQPEDIIVDIFAGVGPFAVYAAKKGCTVFANDLNPYCYMYMDKNLKLNKIRKMTRIYNYEARDFLLNIVKKHKILDKRTKEVDKLPLGDGTVHFILNLPSTAIEYLDTFVGLADNIDREYIRKTMIHCYFFGTERFNQSFVKESLDRIVKKQLENYTITKVRDVAPNKQMYCLEVEFPPFILNPINKGRVRTKTVKRAARQIVEKYYGKLGLDFQYNKKVAEEVALIPSKRMRNKVAGFITHLMRRIQKGPVRGISLKLQEEERERRMDFIPEKSELDVATIQVDQDTADMLAFLKLNLPNLKVMSTAPHEHRERH